jgi:hypothetical protein
MRKRVEACAFRIESVGFDESERKQADGWMNPLELTAENEQKTLSLSHQQ